MDAEEPSSRFRDRFADGPPCFGTKKGCNVGFVARQGRSDDGAKERGKDKEGTKKAVQFHD